MRTAAPFILTALLRYFQVSFAFTQSFSPIAFKISAKSTTHQNMAKMSGLEVREEGATPLPGDMMLYLKAGPDGTSVGDCPFAQYIRMVLHEKSLPYEVIPTTSETKPDWLIEHYGGSLPALRHRKECYVESDVIAQYLDFFFIEPKLSPYSKIDMENANEAINGFFPRVAKYFKHTPDGDDEDNKLREQLEESLKKIDTYLGREEATGPFLVGNGELVSLLDCSLAPKLYHLSTGLKGFKNNAIDLQTQFPEVKAFMDVMFERDSFKASKYPEETIIWGWSNARGN
jgi:glutathione S-transferase